MTRPGKRLAYHGYEGVALDLDEQSRLVADLGAHPAMILCNHGLLTVGASLEEAFWHLYYLERSCAAQLAAQSGGAELVIAADAAAQKVSELTPGNLARGAHIRHWDAAVRQLERLFQKHFEMTPGKYFTRMKMDFARYCLQNSSQNVTDVAYRLGFNSVSHFCKVYKTRFGVAPGRTPVIV